MTATSQLAFQDSTLFDLLLAASQKPHFVVGVVLLLCLAIFIGLKELQRKRQVSSRIPWLLDKDVETVILLEKESTSSSLRLPAVSFITFYEGDSDSIEKHLHTRLRDIVRLNPWLQGRIVRNHKKRVLLKYRPISDANVSLDASTLQFVEDNTLSESLSYDALVRRCRQWSVKIGQRSIDQNEPLFRVTVIRISSSSFAIHVSISHVIADGHTLYRIYSMLSTNNEPTALIVQREQFFGQKLREKLNGEDYVEWIESSKILIANFLWTVMCTPAAVGFVQDIDMDWLQREQQQQTMKANASSTTSQSFVSRNDVLVSWLYKAMHNTIGLMAVNWRSRLSSTTKGSWLTDAHAGNYQSSMLLLPSDFSSPQSIRQSVTLGHRVSLTDKKHAYEQLPKSFGTTVTMISSWVNLFQEISLPGGVKHRWHMPVMDVHSGLKDVCFLFAPRKDEIKLLAITRTFASEKKIPVPSVDGR